MLTTAANSEGQGARAGAENMYVYEPDPAHPGQNETVFIAELCSGPGISGSVGDPECPAGLNSREWFAGGVNDQGLWSHGLEGGDARPVQATPDGQVLVFTSYGELTKEDHSVARQVFEYEAGTRTLKRISIGAEGFNDDGNVGGVGSADARIVTPHYGEGGGGQGGGFARTMSDDGAFVFFESPVGLTPGALDRVPIDAQGDLAENVYEYHGGVVSLISDGRDTSVLSGASGQRQQSAVALIGTDATGADVFFTTADSLVPQDEDTQEDIYDARVDGGFPLTKPQVFCESSCQTPAAPRPASPAPSSGSFFGPGNSSLTVNLIPRPLTSAQRLAAALKVCRKKSRRKRPACEARARKRFASKARAKRTRGATKNSRRGK